VGKKLISLLAVLPLQAYSSSFFEYSGDCELSRDGDCVRSRSMYGDGSYGSSESCRVRVTQSTRIYVTSYEVESCCDYLSVAWGGVRSNALEYKSNTWAAAFSGERFNPGDDIYWTSDTSATYCGWEFCSTNAYPSSQCPENIYDDNVGRRIIDFIGRYYYVLAIVALWIILCVYRLKRQARNRHRAISNATQPIVQEMPRPIPQASPPVVVQAQAVAVPTGTAVAGTSVVEELARLAQLKASGVLDNAQFEAAKAQLLGTSGCGCAAAAPYGYGMGGMMGGLTTTTTTTTTSAQPVMAQAYAVPVDQNQRL